MHVFVLTTGRSGSTTFVRACQHMQNYTAAHQGKSNIIGADRLTFPDNHIESDNRLSWFLGRLDELYGDRAYYVHLHRDPNATTRSFLKRFGWGITRTYYPGIVTRNPAYEDGNKRVSKEFEVSICADLVETMNANIRAFIKHRKQSISIKLEDPKEQFAEFWRQIGADGDLKKALAEWDVRHNANMPTDGAYKLRDERQTRLQVSELPGKFARIAKKLPSFLAEA
ncbi:MAG: hypothetical protein AAFW60_10185 [Pseudomonadota bacterium]